MSATFLVKTNTVNNKRVAKELMSSNIRILTVKISNDHYVDIVKILYQRNVYIGVLLDHSCDSSDFILFQMDYNSLYVTSGRVGTSVLNMVNSTSSESVVRMEKQYPGAAGYLIKRCYYVFKLSNSEDLHSFVFQASKSKFLDAEHIWLVLTKNKNDTLQYIEDKFQHLNLSIDADVAVANRNGDDYTLLDVFNFGRIQGNHLEIGSLGSWSTNNGLSLAYKGFKYYRRWNFHNLTLRAVSVVVDQPEEFKPELLSDNGYTPGIAAMTKITSQLLNLLKESHNFRFNYTLAGRWIGSPERNTTLAVTNSLLWEEQDVSSTCARIFPQWLEWVDVCFPPTTNLQTKFYYIMPDKGVGDYENQFLTPMSEGRKMTLLVVGLTSMLLYNYYTSSVVSWLLNAATPSIDGLDGLINSDLELIFEDIGYSRGWLDKVTRAKRTVNILQPIGAGVELIRSGEYAYHTEPYTASQAISRTFSEDELCELGSLQMMKPANVYIMVQKRSPYKQFLVWSLMRLAERGHIGASRLRFAGTMPACSGRRPRALALGQAAPAFLLLLQLTILSVILLVAERVYFNS
ncbi:putative chemosensory ionotropic receptor IR1 [Operophtera brumata]|uniref:Putative chemosensory ionotropic receptor IR1 n=1 Tax=Operophtera brumata TaxID=104452 RepID=A0A0L7KUC0_OPEBR|nr:putative chemosensory ionotropic receptor IR1 [Operophtera brumata]